MSNSPVPNLTQKLPSEKQVSVSDKILMTFNYNIFSLEWSRSVSLHCSCVGLQVFSNCPFGWLALCHSQMSLHDYKEAEKSALKGTQSCSLFSALFQTFCLTARAYLNTQKYGLFCSLSIHGLKKQVTHYSFVHIYFKTLQLKER